MDIKESLLKRYFRELSADPSVHVERGRLYRGYRLLWAPPRHSNATLSAIRDLLDKNPSRFSANELAASLGAGRSYAYEVLKAIGAVSHPSSEGGRRRVWRMPDEAPVEDSDE